MNNDIKQEFREEEIAIIRHWDKQRNEWITNVFPKIGGRLRLAHEQNEAIDIQTEIYKYDENVAVVIGTCRTAKGVFKGIGMSSVARDQKIAPAILELAETRAIARALRFSGVGVEFCSAEEVSHLENSNQPEKENPRPAPRKQIENQTIALPAPSNNTPMPENNGIQVENQFGRVELGFQPVNSSATVFRPQFKAVLNENPAQNNGNGNASSNGNGNGKERLSNKQYQYILNLTKNKNIAREELNQLTVERFGVYCDFMNRSEASSFIQELQGH